MENENTAVALGAFDGLHPGHAAVIKEAVQKKKEGLVPSILTFTENPSKILTGKTAYLLAEEDKNAILREWGVERIFALDFSVVRELSPEEFFRKILLERCRAKTVVSGENFHFGKDARGDVVLLRQLCTQNGVEFIAVPPCTFLGAAISSTRIRAALGEGNIGLANQLLGRRFGFAFTVVEGNRIGRTLGTPTINQQLPQGFVKPKFGVYASLVTVDGRTLCGVTNIGVKPTVGKYDPLSETWIPDFYQDMYGQNIRVELLAFIRSEKKFDSLQKLCEEIRENAEKAREICAPYLK
ncbi:MAG: riboflavin biosynthesis protein RibF [Oscillospiraceae bacterium]